MNTDDVSTWPDAKQVAAELDGVSVRTIYRALRSGALRWKKISLGGKDKRYRIDPASVQEFKQCQSKEKI
jgi:hypothetical protein